MKDRRSSFQQCETIDMLATERHRDRCLARGKHEQPVEREGLASQSAADSHSRSARRQEPLAIRFFAAKIAEAMSFYIVRLSGGV